MTAGSPLGGAWSRATAAVAQPVPARTYAVVAATEMTVQQPGLEPISLGTGAVLNTILWDGVSDFDPGENLTLVQVLDSWCVINGELAQSCVPGAKKD
jgi:hypothetical protein